MDLDQEIIKVFDLFKGKRSKQEDQDILEKVRLHLIDETLLFLAENLGEEVLIEVEGIIKSASSENKLLSWFTKKKDTNETDLNKILESKLKAVPNWEKKLEARLKRYLNQLFLESTKKE